LGEGIAKKRLTSPGWSFGRELGIWVEEGDWVQRHKTRETDSRGDYLTPVFRNMINFFSTRR